MDYNPLDWIIIRTIGVVNASTRVFPRDLSLNLWPKKQKIGVLLP